MWDSKNNVFCYLNDGTVEYIPENPANETAALSDYWVISDKLHDTYATYYIGDAVEITTNKGFDAGTSGVKTVVYTNEGAAQTATIRTNGGSLTINAPLDTVNHYGEADSVDIKAVADASYHAYGKIGFVQIAQGRFVAEKGAEVNTVIATGAAKIDNEGATVSNVFAKEGVAVTGNVTASTFNGDVGALQQGATMFAGGDGTEANPYLIANAEHFKNIGKLYDDGYYYFAVQSGVTSIELSDIGRVNLNGSFDGKNVVFKNVNGLVFNVVGSGDSADNKAVVLQNFTVQFVGGAGVARCCGATNLSFVNIGVTGYSLQDWNAGLFLRYGTANVTTGGFNYTVNFANCSSSAEVYSTANAWSTILVGHTYQGAGHTTTIKVDKFTDENINGTKVYYTGTNKTPEGKKYYGAKSDTVTVYVDGKETTANTALNIVPVVATKHPAKTEAGDYAIKTEADTTKVVISLTWQYTLWTENYESKIDNQSGVGGLIGDNVVLEVTGNSDVSVFGQITEIEIVTGADKWDYELKDGKLILYMTTDNSYVDGWVTLNVEQYASGSNIAKYKGSMRLALKDKAADWVIY